MTDVLAVAHHERPEAVALIREVAVWLAARGHRVVLLPEDAEALGVEDLPLATDQHRVALALSIGGDGTMLRTVRRVAPAGTPVIGVNLGTLGYLTQVEPPAIFDALHHFFAGEAIIEERMMLRARLVGPELSESFLALNEVVIEKSEPGHTVRLLVCIDGEGFTTYAADGLIVATPTGSTAYALSVRGPIVSPAHRAILLTPVAPHMLFDRTLVLGPEQQLDIGVLGHRHAELTIDGFGITQLRPGDTVSCSVAEISARFVRLGGKPFHSILKTKFGLADR
jgi:NAD+ kinase